VVTNKYGIRNFLSAITQKHSTKKLLLTFVAILTLALPLFGATSTVDLEAIPPFLAQEQELFDGNSQAIPLLEEGIALLESDGRRVVQVSTGTMHVLALRDDGSLWAWGRNNVGQLGLGNTTDQTTPQRVTGGAGTWSSISAAGCPDARSSYSFAIDTDGNLWAWGRGENGQLGMGTVGTTSNQTTPRQITAGPNRWKSISAGWFFTLGIDEDGNLWAWGRNNFGQLAQGNFSDTIQATPIRITSGPSSWQMVGAGRYHAVGICSDANLWTWGSNHLGQLGAGIHMSENLRDARNTPVRITSGAPSWKHLAVGAHYSLAIGTDDSLWAWGAGSLGRLGLGNITENQATLQRVTGGASSWETVSAGAYHSLGVGSDGSLWAWGRNNYGQVGDGNTVDRISPVRIAVSTTGWQATAVSVFQSFAVDGDGNLWSWGWNEYGKLGKGITTPPPNRPSDPINHGSGTDNRMPWRVAASVIPSSTTNWTAHNDATVPRNGGQNITDVNTSEVIIYFDRPMCIEPASLGTIEISHGAFVDMSNITSANWSNSTRGINTVFRAPLILFASNTSHSATVSGFLDAQFGKRGTNEMYPHGWSFRTARVVAPLVVEAISPQGFEVSVATEGIVITFDQAVNTTLPGTVTLNGQALNLSTAVWSERNSVLTIPLPPLDTASSNTLEYATAYTVAVADFVSAEGKAMAGPYHHQFVTEADRIDTTIIKTLLLPEGTPTPNANFIFDIVAHSFNEDSERAYLLPPLSAQTIAFTEAHASTGTENTREVTLSSDYLLDGVTFSQAGLYTYRISERTDTFTNTATESMTFDTRTFEVGFLVRHLPAPATGFYVSALHIQEVLEGEDLAPKTEGPLTFTNEYLRRHENHDPTDPNQAGLRISKVVEGAYANKSQFFDFHITVHAPDLITEPAKYRAYVVESSTNIVVTSTANGTIAGTSTAGAYLNFASGSQQSVALRHGQVLVFVDTHIGTRYSAEEQPAYDYTPSVAVTANGFPEEVVNPEPGTDKVALSTGLQALGIATNTADFTNTHIPTTLTGLTVSTRSAVILIATLLITAALLVLRTRKQIEMMSLNP